jgi:Ca2+-transporting ATPase
LWQRTIATGIVMALGTLAMFRWELEASGSLAQAQTVALTTLVLFQAFHVANSRSEHRSAFAKSPLSNKFLLLSTVLAVLVHVVALHVGATQFVLRVEPIAEAETWLRIVLVASSILAVVELHKFLVWRAQRRAPGAGPRFAISRRR